MAVEGSLRPGRRRRSSGSFVPPKILAADRVYYGDIG